jgi:hypothetical protein
MIKSVRHEEDDVFHQIAIQSPHITGEWIFNMFFGAE